MEKNLNRLQTQAMYAINNTQKWFSIVVENNVWWDGNHITTTFQKWFWNLRIYPFSPEKVLDKMPAAKSFSTANLIDKTAVGQAVLTYLKEHRYKQGVNKKIAPKHKKVNISPGRSISFEELLNKTLLQKTVVAHYQYLPKK